MTDSTDQIRKFVEAEVADATQHGIGGDSVSTARAAGPQEREWLANHAKHDFSLAAMAAKHGEPADEAVRTAFGLIRRGIVCRRILAALSSSPATPEVDPSAEGERCSVCGEPAARKIEEVIPWGEYVDHGPALGKHPPRHPWTAYLCAGHFNAVLFTAPYRERLGIEAKPWPSPATPPEPAAWKIGFGGASGWTTWLTADPLQARDAATRSQSHTVTPLYEAVPTPQADGRPTNGAAVRAVAFVVCGPDSVLMERTPDTHRLYRGEWAVPSGRIEQGETAADALHREMQEELGVAPEEYVSLPAIDCTAEGSPVLFLVQPFAIFSVAGSFRYRTDEGAPVAWRLKSDALRSPVPQVRMMVAAAEGEWTRRAALSRISKAEP